VTIKLVNYPGHSQLEAMTKRWFVEDHANQPHLWEEDTTVFDWLKSQLDPDTGPSSVSQVREAVWIWTRNELSSGLNRLWNKVGLLSLRRKKYVWKGVSY
jgi:hypothetical protein